MLALPSKQALKEELLHIVSSDLEALERAHLATRQAATHEEAKPENDKDTRALEQSYLARGQAMRVEELRTGVGDVQAMPIRPFTASQPMALGALMVVQEGDEEHTFFLTPYGGGTRLAAGKVQVVTPKSPLGRALLGRHVGDDVEVRLADRTRELSIVKVA